MRIVSMNEKYIRETNGMSEAIHIQNPEDIPSYVSRLGKVAEEGIIVGSAAAYLALGGTFRVPHDIDLAVSQEGFNELRRTHPEWTESALSGGRPRLQGDGFDVSVGWHKTQEALQERSWKISRELRVAGLSDVYAWKDQRDLAEDRDDLAILRARLQGEDSLPLTPDVMPQEIDFVQNCLPEHLRDDPDAETAILLAANGLHIVRTVYGDITQGYVNRIVGDMERIEYGALATYHEGGRHTPDGMRWLMRHFSAVNAADRAAGRKETFSKWDFFDGLIAYSYHDAVLGNGRESFNPTSYDELRSSELVQSHANAQGYTRDNAPTKLYKGVHRTTFHEASGMQLGATDPDPFVRAITGVDAQGLSEPDEGIRAYDLAAEYVTSGRPDRGRVVGKALVAREVRAHNTSQVLAFADTYADDRPDPNGMTVRQAVVFELKRDASFLGDIYKYPEGWTGERQAIRAAHVKELRKHTALIEQGGSMLACYELAHRHADTIRERFEPTYSSPASFDTRK